MCERNLSLGNNLFFWFSNGYNKIFNEIKNAGAKLSIQKNGEIIFICISFDKKQTKFVDKFLYNFILDIYTKTAKYNYLKKALETLNANNLNLLLNILTRFDQETEYDIIKNELNDYEFNNNSIISLDGFYNFRLFELRKRWDEIIKLAKDNSLFLTNEDTMFELMRFLLSTIKPEVENILIQKYADKFLIINSKNNTILFEGDEEMLLNNIVNIAPLKITIVGSIIDKNTYHILENLFTDSVSATKIRKNNIVNLFKEN